MSSLFDDLLAVGTPGAYEFIGRNLTDMGDNFSRCDEYAERLREARGQEL